MEYLPTPYPEYWSQAQLGRDAAYLVVDLADFWLWLIGIIIAIMLLTLLATTLVQAARGAREL